MITLNDLKEALVRDYDECSLLDLLEVDSSMIVHAFTELIENRFDYLATELELLDGDEDDYDTY